MNSILRLALAVNRVLPANPQLCYESIATTLDSLVDSPADIILFPQLAFSSPSCGNLFSNQALLESCMERLLTNGGASVPSIIAYFDTTPS